MMKAEGLLLPFLVFPFPFFKPDCAAIVFPSHPDTSQASEAF